MTTARPVDDAGAVETTASRAEPDAASERSGDAGDPGRGLLTLWIGGARFGIWIDETLEIIRTPPISRLPLARPEVAGVTSVRGDLVPVLDLGVRLLETPAERPGRLVLVRHLDSQSIVGLLVDSVETLVSVRKAEVRNAPPEAEAELPAGMVTGVVARDEGVITILHLGGAAAPPVGTKEEG